MYWVEKMELSLQQGGGLGKIGYEHVHDDDSAHPCTLTALTRSGAWMSIPGQYNPSVRVVCKQCGRSLQRGECITLKT